jgi:hypothetical protein
MIIKKTIATIAAAGTGALVFVGNALATTPAPTGLSGAQSALSTIGTTATGISNAGSLPVLIGKIINVVLGLLGIILVVLIVYSGIVYMTSQGDKTKVENAVKNLKSAIIGMVITVAAYAISNYVIQALTSATA